MATSNKTLGGIVKQAQRMNQQIARITDEMSDREVEATAGGGAVLAVVNGRQQLVRLDIDPGLLSPDEAETLRELVITAVNLAMENAKEMMKTEVDKVTGGLHLPGLY
ncbi:MAG: YbaB/EbfC family nucleoid-associated protein [Deltaproteobacteria bacterium]|nr:MAG: YbaB/EbfC family nucleoid-associated protein [Deltaproteobacteria bacterium]